MPNTDTSCGCFREYLHFQRLIAPVVIQVACWVAVVVLLLGGLKVLLTDNFVGGLIVMVLGPILARVVAEFLLVHFKKYDALVEIRNALQKSTRRS